MVDNLSLNLFPKIPPRREIAMVSVVHPEINKDLKQDSKKKLILPISLITGGGILLYYGIKSPTKSRVIKNIVKDRVSQMQSNLNVYTQTVDDTIDVSYKKIAEYISRYIEENSFTFPGEMFTNLNNPKKIIKTQDLAFDAIDLAADNRPAFGVSGMGKFSLEIDKVNKSVNDKLNRKKELMRLLFEDYAKLPQVEDEGLNKLIVSSSANLKEKSAEILGKMEVYKFIKYKNTVAKYYEQMAQIITDTRNNQTNAKRQIIDVSFAKIAQLLDLGDDFVPSYRKLPELTAYKELTNAELKPVRISRELKDAFGGNVYFKEAAKIDFNKINDEDIHRIFYSAYYNNNLEDLRLLIDRLRLRQAVSAEKEKNQYRNLIAKLEYLLIRLKDYGESELIKRVSKDFSQMNPEQKRAALYYVSTVSRRLGFSTIEDMDKYMSVKNPDYAKLEIREYMELFKENPELYYF